ncbi:uncharacterized protein LOC122129256 [Clupea harengus]|uniref:Uncharacterized protein LOC122129256 n=1 Tax=Clupea harengus TaxID=7950 RepID=A0A8M1K8I4_CLUHA|nr:uncharacterized protein LOC122129256 [Clupea harengus]
MKSSLLCPAILIATIFRTMAENMTDSPEPTLNTTVFEHGTTLNGTEPISTVSSDASTQFDNTTVRRKPHTSHVTKASAPPPMSSTTTNVKPVVQTCQTLTELLELRCPSVLIMGGLAIGCVILLFSTMALACQVCHLKSQIGDYSFDTYANKANGRRRADDGEPNEATIMMSEVAKEDEMEMKSETARDEEGDGESQAENNQPKEQEKDVNETPGSDQSPTEKTDAAESDKTAASGDSDVIKSSVNEAEKPEENTDEAAHNTIAETKDVTGGSKKMADAN